MIKLKTLFCIIGGSASGKDSLCNILEKCGYNVVKSYTTRPRRENEVDTHIFIKKEDVSKYINKFVAYTKIGDYEYFTTKKQLENNDVYIIDPKGYEYLCEKIKDIKLVPILINIKECERFKRALNRGDKKEDIEKRFMAEHEQFEKFKTSGEYYSIINYDLYKAFEILIKIIEIEREY
jgi:guanylate kinase